MSSSVYGARTGSRNQAAASAATKFGCRRTQIFEDRPQSRLSKRITRKPRSANPWRNASGHAIICVPSPMMSRIGGAAGSPIDSYSIVMPLAATAVMSAIGPPAATR
jgi:hypothetical protein